MAQETPFKDRKRGGDVTGRGPKHGNLKADLKQGSSTRRSTPCNIGKIMGQDASSKGKSPFKLKSLMRQG